MIFWVCLTLRRTSPPLSRRSRASSACLRASGKEATSRLLGIFFVAYWKLRKSQSYQKDTKGLLARLPGGLLVAPQFPSELLEPPRGITSCLPACLGQSWGPFWAQASRIRCGLVLGTHKPGKTCKHGCNMSPYSLKVLITT